MIDITTITETIENYEVKELRFNKRDNIITGRVKCPYNGKKTLHEGFIGCTWTTQGKPTSKHGGTSRTDLILKVI